MTRFLMDAMTLANFYGVLISLDNLLIKWYTGDCSGVLSRQSHLRVAIRIYGGAPEGAKKGESPVNLIAAPMKN
jgi:hypothetical protein